MKNKHLQLLAASIVIATVLAGYVTNNFQNSDYEYSATVKADVLDKKNKKQQISFPKLTYNKVR